MRGGSNRGQRRNRRRFTKQPSTVARHYDRGGFQRKLLLEQLEDRRLLSTSPITGKTGDIVPVDLKSAVSGIDDLQQNSFDVIGFDHLSDQNGSQRTPLTVDVNVASGDLELKDGDTSAGYIVFSDRADENLAPFSESGLLYVAPGTEDGLSHDLDAAEPGYQGYLRVWVRADEPLFPVVTGVSQITTALDSGQVPDALHVQFEMLDSVVALSSVEQLTVDSREIGAADNALHSHGWLLVDRGLETAYSIELSDGMLVVSTAYHADLLVGSGYSMDQANGVSASTDSVVDIMRQQQRLKYLGFPGQTSDLVVNGVMDNDTQHAIGLFSAVATDTSHQLLEQFNTDGSRFINESNAPRWVDLADPSF
ncbi:MAG: hypothetical protein VB877_17860, partial [Pirellulaceae bacterium]